MSRLDLGLARLAGLSLRRRMLISALAGAVAALGQAPLNLWPLTILGLAAITWIAMTDLSPRRTGWLWWAGGCGYFGLALSWIVEPFLVDIARHGWMAPFALVGMGAGMAIFWGLAGLLARVIAPATGWRFASATALVLPLTGALRGWIFTGFPWALPGHALIASPALQLASLGGAILLGLIVTSAAATLPLCLRPKRLAVWGACFALPMLAGWTLTPPPAQTEGRPIIRLVQPNVPQHEKWDRDKAPAHFQRLLDLSASPGDHALTVWPETAVPAWLNDVPHLMPVIAEAAAPGATVFGINRAEGREIRNALVVLDPEGEIADVYDKHHLVPFGEYVPFGNILGQLGIRGMAARDGNGFSPGPGAHLVDIPGAGRALPLICYEGVFPRDIRAAPERPDVLLLITNDAWFGTISGPYQHLAQARLRAVEFGLPMIRVANTGISAMIDPAGRVSGRMALGTAGISDQPLPEARPETLYARLGDLPLIALLIIGLAAIALPRARNF
ncbi:apolipoprotein N-acyltransferase [Pseudooceanicola sp. C21-150M6]|uniref:apolipoprotein N-acyltransferase n=1 Tax=Pseudooceanicola sp. C21-150M6 TaxID=3434355 RepID=UPI003D7F740D